jgi:hypothetical protein
MEGRWGAAIAGVLVAAALAGCTGTEIGAGSQQPAPTTAPTSAPAATAPGTAPGPVAVPAVDALEVRTSDDPLLPDYRRAEFGGDWAYDPSSGCNTRERVLIEESLIAPDVDDRCRPSNGRWRSIYDDVETTDPADLQIDHVVPLADAWRSGAAAWSHERRVAFANDLDDPATLAAVTGRSNQQKSDSTPDRWLPEHPAARCRYARDWVAIKQRWDLSVTPAEKSALVQVLSGC